MGKVIYADFGNNDNSLQETIEEWEAETEAEWDEFRDETFEEHMTRVFGDDFVKLQKSIKDSIV